MIAIGVIATGVLANEARASDPTPPLASSGWTGCHVGVSAGISAGRQDTIDEPNTNGVADPTGFSWNSPDGSHIKSDGRGFSGGLNAGCDWQSSVGETALVFGGIIDLASLGASGDGISALSSDTHTTFDANWAATLRGRLGVATDSLLLFVTGGVAFADIDVGGYDHDTVPGSGIMDATGGGHTTGWVAGAGGEWKLDDHLTVGLEYLHMKFDGLEAADTVNGVLFDSDIGIDTVRVGLNWRM